MEKIEKSEEEVYIIDEETMKTCKALEFYDIHGNFPFEKKKVLITLSYDSVDKLKSIKNKSALIDSLIMRSLVSYQ